MSCDDEADLPEKQNWYGWFCPTIAKAVLFIGHSHMTGNPLVQPSQNPWTTSHSYLVYAADYVLSDGSP